MRERELFIEALQREDTSERAAYVDEACAGDDALRQRVNRLLEEHKRQESFVLDSPPPGMTGTVLHSIVEAPGAQIGPYKLLEQIGEGGFGVVFMAEQHEPLRRKIALKIVKPGMDTRQVIARFEAERQALAVMEHPNIAKVFDAGATKSGRPYFVMELVKGLPITDYCDEAHLTAGQRLELFLGVCLAVQHAHQKGIIHRDLKPSNVLVTVSDGQPMVKVIDFGVAKATGGQLTEKTVFTGFAQMIGTPLYMSPEQAGLTVDIDTRSDIYSLGVLLYELLTGSTPFGKERFQEAAYDEIRRIIREEEPPKPSTKLSSSATLPSIAANRHTEPARLSKEIRGELDWIVMKALEKDRSRRYETANGLAMDIERYLANKPVLAGPPSAVYRLGKFARRNQVALLTASLVAVALVVGTVVSTSQAVRARRAEGLAETRLAAETQARAAEAKQRKVAEDQRDRAVQAEQQAEANLRKAREAVDRFYTLVSERALLEAPGLQSLREELMEAALRYYEGFLEQAGDDPKVQTELAATCFRLAQIYHLNDRNSDCLEALQKGLAIVEPLLATDPNLPELSQQLGGALKSGARRINRQNVVLKKREMYQALERSIAVWEQLVQQNPSALELQSDLAMLLSYAGELLRPGKGSEPQLRKALALLQNLVNARPAVPEYRVEMARTELLLGQTAFATGHRDEGEEALRHALGTLEKLVADYPSVAYYQEVLATVNMFLGDQVKTAGRPAESLPLHRCAMSLFSALDAKFPGVPAYREGVAKSFRAQAQALAAMNEFQEAADLYQQAIGIWKQLADAFPNQPNYRWHLAIHYRELGMLLRRSGQVTEAEVALQEAVRLGQQLAAEDPRNSDIDFRQELNRVENELAKLRVYLMNSHRAIAQRQTGQERLQTIREAISVCRSAVEGARTMPENLLMSSDYQAILVPLGRNLAGLAELLAHSGEFPEVAEISEQLIEVSENLVNLSGSGFESLGHACRWLSSTRGHEEKYLRIAIAAFERCIAREPTRQSHRSYLADTLCSLGERLLGRNEMGEAESCFRKATRDYETLVKESPNNREYRMGINRSYTNLSTVLRVQDKRTEAEETLRGIAEKLGDDPDLLHAYALTLHGAGLHAEAEQSYREALLAYRSRGGNNSVDVAGCLYDLARVLSDQAKHGDAEEVCRQAIVIRRQAHGDTDPRVAADLELLATLFDHQKKPLAELSQAFPDAQVIWSKQSVDYLNGTAWRLASDANPAHHNPALAVTLAKLAVERAPDQGYIVNTLGTAYYRAGEWKAAIETLKEADALYQGQHFSSDALFIAMAHWQLGDRVAARKWYTAAARWMDQFAADNEEQRRFRFEAASLLGSVEQPPAAPDQPLADDRELYALILDAWPEAAWAYLRRGRLLESTGESQQAQADYRYALKLYERAIEAKPDSAQPWAERGAGRAALERWQEAAGDFEKAAALGAGPTVWYWSALARLGANDPAGYRQACAGILARLAKLEAGVPADLAVWACALGPDAATDLAPAVAAAEKAVQANSASLQKLTTLEALLYRVGRLEDAVQRLEQVKQLGEKPDADTSPAYAWYFLAMANHRLGQTEQAQRCLNKAIDHTDKVLGVDSAGKTSLSWNRRLTLVLLRNEAQTLLSAAAPPR